MPPHCDTLDGPVVLAAKKALETENINVILPWVYLGGEAKIREAFGKTLEVRKLGNNAATELADYWFYETVVRIHREGEGAGFTGLKPAGTDFGPVLPLVDESLKTGTASEIKQYLNKVLNEAIDERFLHANHSKDYDVNDVKAARQHVNAYLSLALFSHHLFQSITGDIVHGEVEEKAGKESGHHH